MRILVTGACGYKGTVLVSKLLQDGHFVFALDAMWFGNYLPQHPRLSVSRADIRYPSGYDFPDVEAVIHLASVANDPCGELDPSITWETSCLATMQIADAAVRAGVRQFIYASSGSVYGVKQEDQVTEDLKLEPISIYNKSKMVAERVLLSYANDIAIQIVRPATVCGYSERMRFDVSVNMMTIQALEHGRMTVFGGDQVRPNIHMTDICDVYLHLLRRPDLTGIFNAGFENLTIRAIAEMVAKHVPAEIAVVGSNDPRSYRVNSDKLLATGFRPKHTVEDAIRDLAERFRAGTLRNRDEFNNLKWMQRPTREVA